jgi:hypothetical protein
MGILMNESGEKTKPNKPKQSQFWYLAGSTNQRQDFVSTNQELFHGLDCRKGYTALNVKSEIL